MQELVLRTIQSYRTNPDETAAEESWDYAQFQVCELVSPVSQSPVVSKPLVTIP